MNQPAVDQDDAAGQLAFFQKLQRITNRIHATARVEEIMLDLGLDFCDLLDCDRFTLYAVTPDKEHIVSKVKTGLSTFRDLRLPLGPSSIAGFAPWPRCGSIGCAASPSSVSSPLVQVGSGSRS